MLASASNLFPSDQSRVKKIWLKKKLFLAPPPSRKINYTPYEKEAFITGCGVGGFPLQPVQQLPLAGKLNQFVTTEEVSLHFHGLRSLLMEFKFSAIVILLV